MEKAVCPSSVVLHPATTGPSPTDQFCRGVQETTAPMGSGRKNSAFLAMDLRHRGTRVVGTSEVKVAPDRAVIELGVEEQNASASLAKQSADAASRKILEDLRTSGIDEKD